MSLLYFLKKGQRVLGRTFLFNKIILHFFPTPKSSIFLSP